VDEAEPGPSAPCPSPPPLRGWEDELGRVDPLEDVCEEYEEVVLSG